MNFSKSYCHNNIAFILPTSTSTPAASAKRQGPKLLSYLVKVVVVQDQHSIFFRDFGQSCDHEGQNKDYQAAHYEELTDLYRSRFPPCET